MILRNLINGSLIALLCASLMCSVAYTAGHADAPIAATADEIRPLKIGDDAPRFVVESVDGEPVDFNPARLERPVVLAAFRGGWCPYCNTYLSEMRHVLPEIDAMGVDVLFLSGDAPHRLFESLSKQTQEDIAELDYTILSDRNAQAAIALGIAFRVSERTMTKLDEMGKDVAGSSITHHGVLPVPAVFAIGKDGVIRYAYTNANYEVRLPAEELLEVAREIAAN